MRVIRVTQRYGKVPVYIPINHIGAVSENTIFHAGKKAAVGTNQASILVQGVWIEVTEDSYYVGTLIRDATEL
jgi:hypothetical protein